MKALLSLAITYLTLGVQTQFIAQPLNPYNDADPNRIYFEDNRPRFTNNVAFNPNIQEFTTPAPNMYNTKETYQSEFDIHASVQTAKSQRESKRPAKNSEPTNQAETEAPSAFSSQDIQVIPIQSSFHLGPASSEFGVNIFKQIAQEQSGNIAVSPFSISILLAMLQQGATGGTLEQITKVLQMTPEKSAETYKQLTGEIQKRNSRNILKSANNIFLSETFNLNTQFKRTAVNNFGSDLTPMNFGKPTLAAQNINNWVASKTNNKIDNLINADALSANTQMVMINAVYFKGSWEIPFREQATQNRPFTLKSGEKKTAPFMHTRRYFKANRDKTSNTKVVVLPFESNEFSLFVILPHESTNVDALLATLTMADMASYVDFPPTDVVLELPKFSIRADTDLKPVLKKMGVTNIFDRQSELSNLGTYGSFSPQVSSALHTAVLSIDEKGGSAAAATSFSAVALSYDEPSLYFRANRPFIVALWDNRASIPLFMARIMDPTV